MFRVCLFRVLEVVCVLFSSLLFGKVSLLLYSYFKVIAHQSAFACGDKNRERERKKKRFSRRVEEETLRRERRKGTVLLVLVLHDRRRERTWKRL